jgi:hypothetical protein
MEGQRYGVNETINDRTRGSIGEEQHIVQPKQAIRRQYGYSTVHTRDFMGPRFLKVSNRGMSESGIVQAMSQWAQSVSRGVPDGSIQAVVLSTLHCAESAKVACPLPRCTPRAPAVSLTWVLLGVLQIWFKIF